MAQYKPRPNVSGGAGGSRYDRRANVKDGARLARRKQDADEIAAATEDCMAIVGGTPGDPGGTLSYCGLPLPCPDHDAPRDEVTP